jgi:hypothetical protein
VNMREGGDGSNKGAVIMCLLLILSWDYDIVYFERCFLQGWVPERVTMRTTMTALNFAAAGAANSSSGLYYERCLPFCELHRLLRGEERVCIHTAAHNYLHAIHSNTVSMLRPWNNVFERMWPRKTGATSGTKQPWVVPGARERSNAATE